MCPATPGCWSWSPTIQSYNYRNIVLKSEEYLTNLDTREPSVIAFKVENLQCKVSINPDNSFQSLHLKVAPDDPSQWQPDQLTIIQKFFDAKVSQKL